MTSLSARERERDIVMGFNLISLTFGGKTSNVDATTQSASVEKVRNRRRRRIAECCIGAHRAARPGAGKERST